MHTVVEKKVYVILSKGAYVVGFTNRGTPIYVSPGSSGALELPDYDTAKVIADHLNIFHSMTNIIP